LGAIITLTSDFGLTDAYAAAIKGVILGINPDATLVDICHNIKAQGVAQAAFVLKTAYPYFPKKAVHLVVVDPGVGSERHTIVFKTPEGCFVAPDNGVLSYVIARYLARPLSGEPLPQQPGVARLYKAELSKEVEAVAISNSRFFRTPVSPTFHGRDIMAPVAALLSLGLPLVQFGQPLSWLAAFQPPEPERAPGGSLVGHILHVDGFGNLITDIRQEDLPGTDGLTVEVGGRTIDGLASTYAEGRGLLALVGSSGHLEVAMRDGSACSMLGARLGDEVIVRTAKSR